MAIPKLPKSTMIAGERWRVVCRREVFLDGEACEGVTHFPEKVIEIAVASNDEYSIMSAFYHEVAHAIIHTQAPTLDPDIEHSIIAGLERWLATNTSYRKVKLKPAPVKVPKGQRATTLEIAPKQKKKAKLRGRK
jgi:hypothetical protein